MICIHNAKVYTMAGQVIENGYVSFENGKITSVGAMKDYKCSSDCVKIDAEGIP